LLASSARRTHGTKSVALDKKIHRLLGSGGLKSTDSLDQAVGNPPTHWIERLETYEEKNYEICDISDFIYFFKH
jgi:hypothetical protein